MEKQDDFNPLHREGGDAMKPLTRIKHKEFQSTPPRGWRPVIIPSAPSLSLFQSTPPRGWRREISITSHGRRVDFNPLHREGGDDRAYCWWTMTSKISIHSTARVETAILHNNHYYSPRKSMFASGSHQNTLYRFTARGQVRISAVLPH